jgi:hypothetical protein
MEVKIGMEALGLRELVESRRFERSLQNSSSSSSALSLGGGLLGSLVVGSTPSMAVLSSAGMIRYVRTQLIL